MRLTRAALLLTAALLPFSAQAELAPAAPVSADAPADAQVTAVPAAPIAVAPLNFTERTLANGLRVYAIQDKSTANVAVQVWYDVGSKDDPAGKSGFAHMFEHLMFKSTRNLVAEQMDRLTEDVGGYNNASTAADYTNYFEVVPANHLQRLLFAEADRMASLVVDQKTFDAEREVVKEELRSRVLAQPYGKLFYIYFPMISYRVHPYARPGIGSIADLDAATLDDIRTFHATYYRPDNAVLVVSGNFEADQLDKWVDQYFAPIAKPDRPIPRVTVTEPVRAVATRTTVYEPNTPLPALMLSYQIPPEKHADSVALAVLDAILTSGRNSRFYRNMVYRDQLASDVGSYLDSGQATGSYALYSILADGRSPADGEAALRREIAALRDTLVTPEELAEAKNEILTGVLKSRETADGKASALASSIITNGDPRHSDRQLAMIDRVTAQDIQRVARQYLGDAQSALINYLPEEMANGAKSDVVQVADTVQVAPLPVIKDIPVHVAATDAERIQPPAPGAAVDPSIPTPVVTTLTNGLRVVTVEKRDLPIVTATLLTPSGAVTDPVGKAGTAALATSLLIKGTTTRSAEQIAQQIESLGGSINAGADWDAAYVTVTVKADQIQPALNILADTTRNPAFAQAEIDRERTQGLDGLKVALKDPGTLASAVAGRLVFGNHPYGNLVNGTPASLPRVTRDDLLASYRRAWQPGQATLVITGDITQADALKYAEGLFGDWKAKKQAPVKQPKLAATAPRVIIVDMPDAGQAGVVVARQSLTGNDPRLDAALVANATLGTGFTSRLNREIRIKRGLSYGASSTLDARRLAGTMRAATKTKNQSAAEVVQLITAEMQNLGSQPVGTEELDSRKAVLIGEFGRTIERTSGINGTITDLIASDKPVTQIKTFIGGIQRVTPDQVQQAANSVMSVQGANIVVVGDAKQFADDLRKIYPNLEIIPATALNLDSATLK